jgi:hypothetical protein
LSPGAGVVPGRGRIDLPGQADDLFVELGDDARRDARIVRRVPVHPVGGASVAFNFEALHERR